MGTLLHVALFFTIWFKNFKKQIFVFEICFQISFFLNKSWKNRSPFTVTGPLVEQRIFLRKPYCLKNMFIKKQYREARRPQYLPPHSFLSPTRARKTIFLIFFGRRKKKSLQKKFHFKNFHRYWEIRICCAVKFSKYFCTDFRFSVLVEFLYETLRKFFLINYLGKR